MEAFGASVFKKNPLFLFLVILDKLFVGCVEKKKEKNARKTIEHSMTGRIFLLFVSQLLRKLIRHKIFFFT